MGIYLGDTSVVSGGGGGGGGGYICTVTGCSNVPWAEGASFAIASSYNGYSTGGVIQFDKNEIGSKWINTCGSGSYSRTVCNDGSTLTFSGCIDTPQVSFFGGGNYSGRVGYVDVLVVGGGADGSGCYGGKGGDVIEAFCYPLYDLGQGKPVSVGYGGRTSQCGGDSMFGEFKATAGGANGNDKPIQTDSDSVIQTCLWGRYPGRFCVDYTKDSACCSIIQSCIDTCVSAGYCIRVAGVGSYSSAGAGGTPAIPTYVCTICRTTAGNVGAGRTPTYRQNGGIGYLSSISGSAKYYGGGGGGTGIAEYSCEYLGYKNGTVYSIGYRWPYWTAAILPGCGGCGGGGNGGMVPAGCCGGCYGCSDSDFLQHYQIGGDATYYGGGGGGGYCSYGCAWGGKGCQGVVIIRYKADGSSGIKNTSFGGDEVYVCNGYRIHVFKTPGAAQSFYPVFN